jgi:Fe-S-cluster containining protein
MVTVSAKSPFYAQGLRFSCTRCSACCRFDSGYVFLSEKDILNLKIALKIKNNEFLTTFCRWVSGENGEVQLSLKEKSDFDCIFWSPKEGCSVYDKRPLQCRAFPFWTSVLADENCWKMTAASCPGMNNGELHSYDSIKNLLALRQKEPIISNSVRFKGES